MQKVGREQEVSDNASTLGRLPFIAAACIDFVSVDLIYFPWLVATAYKDILTRSSRLTIHRVGLVDQIERA
ncbi:hypothetical protein H5410_009818 [Solanum commersonii]|uniref:Uncharacterized protein n=1 Tax=Solanum commersonii TaxID=4109 RepID=A0A9J6AJ05_SOLCO|nr:hypothetical protein H5410_009818 [Solanum commersonii]